MLGTWRMRAVALGLVATGALAALAGCSSTTTDSSYAEGGDRSGAPASNGSGDFSGGSETSTAPGSSGAPSSGTDGNGGPVSQPAPDGQLTAGVWDDNLNFDFFTKYITTQGQKSGLPIFSPDERTAAKNKFAQRGAVSELDVAFLVDTTGSMSDELAYIQKELSSIAGDIGTRFPGTQPRFGLVFYRDHGDEYVTRWFDFSSDLATVKANLDAQVTNGGGDYPEAVPEGLSQAMSLSWRTGPVARMTFWVGDAPQHITESKTTRAALDAAIQKDVHLYPVSASGTDELLEATMRSAAQITGGRYLFLTNDSGVGGSHKEPSIPCYHVTKFTNAMVRMVESEMKGTRIEPDAADVLRTVGNPQDGRCTLQSQEQVTIY